MLFFHTLTVVSTARSPRIGLPLPRRDQAAQAIADIVSPRIGTVAKTFQRRSQIMRKLEARPAVLPADLEND